MSAHIALSLGHTQNGESWIQAIVEEYRWGESHFLANFGVSQITPIWTKISAPRVVYWWLHISQLMRSPNLI